MYKIIDPRPVQVRETAPDIPAACPVRDSSMDRSVKQREIAAKLPADNVDHAGPAAVIGQIRTVDRPVTDPQIGTRRRHGQQGTAHQQCHTAGQQ